MVYASTIYGLHKNIKIDITTRMEVLKISPLREFQQSLSL